MDTIELLFLLGWAVAFYTVIAALVDSVFLADFKELEKTERFALASLWPLVLVCVVVRYFGFGLVKLLKLFE